MNYPSFETQPQLIEYEMKMYIKNCLTNCHHVKEKYYNFIYNSILLFFFLLFVILTLYFCYKGKLTPEEKIIKEMEKKKFVLSKINKIQQENVKKQQDNITGLPNW
jgi:hypothetical protein